MTRYCKNCKCTVQEKHLYKNERCGGCGAALPKPFEFTAKRSRFVARTYDVLVEYRDKATKELKTVVYTDVSEEYYNRIKYSATNVVNVTTLTRKES